MKDKQIAVFSEKLNSHLVLFSLVEREVSVVKQILGNVHCLVSKRECFSDVYSLYGTVISVADLMDKVQRISVLKKDVVGMAASCSLALSDCDFRMVTTDSFYLLLCSNSCSIYAEKLNFLESKISAYRLELQSRARIMYELKDHLEAEKLNHSFLKKALLVKDGIYERLTSVKQVILLSTLQFSQCLKDPN
ncbi:hypothetical protein BAE44_0016720 [Dichanthelium oligosanthes]|uniref:Uncharacterized protein n=1 Tax=Dichanthelium oligosanthes TaxID=888268 RepID=A0A1E5VB68_9POAL|nr:hypothetical protein BAE44_0016720 [Dichanthelium oligosanthes]